MIMNDKSHKQILKFLRRKGRKIVVDANLWKWTCSKRGGVSAYCFDGRHYYAHASEVKGQLQANGNVDPEIFYRGQYKRTSDGMICPKDVAKWIRRKEY